MSRDICLRCLETPQMRPRGLEPPRTIQSTRPSTRYGRRRLVQGRPDRPFWADCRTHLTHPERWMFSGCSHAVGLLMPVRAASSAALSLLSNREIRGRGGARCSPKRALEDGYARRLAGCQAVLVRLGQSLIAAGRQPLSGARSGQELASGSPSSSRSTKRPRT